MKLNNITFKYQQAGELYGRNHLRETNFNTYKHWKSSRPTEQVV